MIEKIQTVPTEQIGFVKFNFNFKEFHLFDSVRNLICSISKLNSSFKKVYFLICVFQKENIIH